MVDAPWTVRISSLNVLSAQMMVFDAIDVRLDIILVFLVLASRRRLIIVQSLTRTSIGSIQVPRSVRNAKLKIALSVELKASVLNALRECSQPSLVLDADITLKDVLMKTM